MPQAQVFQVPEGSIVCLSGVALDEPSVAALQETIETVVGHRRFGLLWFDADGNAEVWGPDTDIKARLTELLAETTSG